MKPSELLERIQRGEDSKTQFKETINHVNQLAQELVAFSNSDGGLLLIGVRKNGDIVGLSFDEIEKINQHISNAASQHVKAPVTPITENVSINGKTIIAVNISKGANKPYYTNDGVAYVKMGSDKRIASPEAILRLFQSSGKIYADEMIINGTSDADIDTDYYKGFINRKYNKAFEDLGIEFRQSLENLNLMKEGNLTLAGLLFFSFNRHKFKPQFSIQCVAINSTTLSGNSFTDNEAPFEGNMKQVFDQTTSFINRNLKKIPTGNTFNSQTVWEIPYEVFEELIVNSLIHRDYFISSTIKVFVFSDRIEIISPGKLPNALTVENVTNGVAISRNPILQTMAQKTLPYKGLGTGLIRAISFYPDIKFINEKENDRFIVVIKRPLAT